MKNVQTLLNKEAQIKESLQNILVEKEEMAVNTLAEAHEIVKLLGCDHLLNKAQVIEKIIEKTIEVEIQVPGPVQIVKDMQEIEKALSERDKAIEDLTTAQQLIEDLKAQLLSKEEVDIPEQPILSEEEEYLMYLSTQQYEEEAEEIEDVIEQLEQQPVQVKLTNAKLGKHTQAKIYATDKCYLIASPTTDEITWITESPLTDEYKTEIERVLVDKFNFYPTRTVLSPIKIERENGYMARVSASKGYDNFTREDIVSGYVRLGKKFFLYSYCPAKNNAYVDSFDRKLANCDKTMPNREVKISVVNIIKDMYAEYEAKLNNKKDSDNKKAEEVAKAFNEKQDARRQQREADEALILAAGLKINNNKKVDTAPKQVILSSSLQDAEDELF